MAHDWLLISSVVTSLALLAWTILLNVRLAKMRRLLERVLQEREAKRQTDLAILDERERQLATWDANRRENESSALFSLKELLRLEEGRVQGEELRREELRRTEELRREHAERELRQREVDKQARQSAEQRLQESRRRAEVDQVARRAEEIRQLHRADALRANIERVLHDSAKATVATISGGKSRVLFRAGAPRSVAPDTEVSVRFVAYAPEEEAEVKALLEGVAEGAEARREFSETSWALGTKAEVKCYGESVRVTPEVQDFIWEGKRSHLDFDVAVPANARIGDSVRIRFDVSVEGFVVARLRIPVLIARREAISKELNEVVTQAARSAFASYASPDRARVLDRVASVRTLTGMEVWMDCVNLRPNDRWQELLGPEIEKRDLFFLFWSTQAAESRWVDWEWRTALARKGLDAIQLHPLENAPDSVPKELREIHANDPLMALRSEALGSSCPCGSGRLFSLCHGRQRSSPS